MSNNVKIGQEPEKNEKKLQEEQKERNRVIDLTNNNEKSQPDLPSTALSSDPATEEQDKGNIREKDSESDVKNKKKQEESAPAPFHEQIEKNTKEEKQSPELEIPKEAQIEMYEETMKTVHKGNIVEGTIMKIDSNEVFVDIGFKAEGVIPLSEFDNVEELREGDKVEVFIIRKEDRQGRPRLSKRYADVKRLWDEIEEAYKTGEHVSGKIVERVKGGLMVDIRGIKAFLPASHASTKVLPNLDYFVGKKMNSKLSS